MKRILASAAFLLALASAAFGQAVQQSGPVTPNTSPIWSGTGIIKGGNTATDSPLTTFGITRDAVDAFCVSSARSTAVGRNQLCLQAATNGPAKISLQNYGTATAQNIEFVLNGVPLILPSGGGTFLTGVPPYTLGHAICVNATTGVLSDCGVSVAAGNIGGVPTYSTVGTLTSTPTPSAGQALLGQTGAGAAFVSLSGDVGSVAANGTLTLNKVNGIPFNNSYASHGVLIGEGSSAFGTVTTPSIGQCLLSQGASSDPIWSACASGAGSAGGSNTQVQFNNSTALGGSVNLTWVSPALTIGVAGTTTGQLALAPVAGASGTVTIQNPSATSAYNFNLPTAAGSSGQPLLSGGGGATAMSFGTLGIVGGGTNCSSATGTCLDNITGFASTGYVNRTGAGTYAFSTVIPAGNGGTGLATGTSGGIIGFTGTATIASSALLAQNGIMIGGGAGATPTAITACSNGQIPVGATSAAPACQTLSGDIGAVTSGGAVTIANSAITVAKQANAAAYSLGGNFTGSPAAPQYSTIGALTQKASPAASDLILIQDQAASGQMKYATVSSVSSAGSVSSIDSATGSFTTSNGLTTSANVIQLTAARRTLPTITKLTSGTSATYTTPANCLWIEVKMVGGGGGGAGGGTTAGTGGVGGTTIFGLHSAPGGTQGTAGVQQGPAGGTGGTIGAGAIGREQSGFPGSSTLTALTGPSFGGVGGGSMLGPGGQGANGISSAGLAAPANSGGGGGGGGGNNSQIAGASGAGGDGLDIIINSPVANYTYTIGAGGTAGATGTNGTPGGAGGSGFIFVIEHYGT